MKSIRVSILIISVAASGYACGQNLPGEKIEKDQIEFTKWFDNQVETNPLIYSNPTYPLKIAVRFGHQFFKTSSWQNGMVCMGDQFYFDLPLLLDIQSEQLVVKQPNYLSSYGVALKTSDISYFEIGASTFVVLQSNQGIHFYEVLVRGSVVDLVAKHEKVPYLESDGSHIKSITNYFLYFKGSLIELKSKSSLNQITPEFSSIAREIRSKDSKFNLRKEGQLSEFIRRFDEKVH